MSMKQKLTGIELLLELDRLDVLFQPHYLKAVQGDAHALDACLTIMERRASLLGLDSPPKHQIEVGCTGGVLVVPDMMD